MEDRPPVAQVTAASEHRLDAGCCEYVVPAVRPHCSLGETRRRKHGLWRGALPLAEDSRLLHVDVQKRSGWGGEGESQGSLPTNLQLHRFVFGLKRDTEFLPEGFGFASAHNCYWAFGRMFYEVNS